MTDKKTIVDTSLIRESWRKLSISAGERNEREAKPYQYDLFKDSYDEGVSNQSRDYKENLNKLTILNWDGE